MNAKGFQNKIRDKWTKECVTEFVGNSLLCQHAYVGRQLFSQDIDGPIHHPPDDVFDFPSACHAHRDPRGFS